MNEARLDTIEQIREFLAGTADVVFSTTEDQATRHRFVATVLRRHRYFKLCKGHRGVLFAYMQRLTGYTRQHLTKLVAFREDYALGMRYIKAIGVKGDTELGFRLVRRSALAGFAPAQYAMGFLLTGGIGTGTDEVAALDWLKRSADQGNADAMHGVGNAYANGWGVGKSLNLANQWYCKAAQHGNPHSIEFVKRRPPEECPLSAPAPAKQSALSRQVR